ncbi:MAG TPA: hypothetical protein VJ867_07345 [Gemmatimonadaceae bacterium]|nr:hypothetical protein [Gemmatimonadaceae bacterium]
MQQNELVPVQYRQKIDFGNSDGFGPPLSVDSIARWAAAHPGKLYVLGDEPNGHLCIEPAAYARMFHDAVLTIRASDSTALFSPAGFQEISEPCLHHLSSYEYADAFYKAYVEAYRAPPPAQEYRFHAFAALAAGDTAGWFRRVDSAAAWASAHSKPMVLGSWGFHGWLMSDSAFAPLLRRMLDSLQHDPRVIQVVWYRYEREREGCCPHTLTDSAGNLTTEGLLYSEFAARRRTARVPQ